MNVRRVTSLDEAVQLLELSDVRYENFGFERVDDTGRESGQIDLGMQYSESHDPAGVITVLRLETTTQDARLTVKVACFFACDEPLVLADDVKEDFVRQVALATLAPFGREALVDLSLIHI